MARVVGEHRSRMCRRTTLTQPSNRHRFANQGASANAGSRWWSHCALRLSFGGVKSVDRPESRSFCKGLSHCIYFRHPLSNARYRPIRITWAVGLNRLKRLVASQQSIVAFSHIARVFLAPPSETMAHCPGVGPTKAYMLRVCFPRSRHGANINRFKVLSRRMAHAVCLISNLRKASTLRKLVNDICSSQICMVLDCSCLKLRTAPGATPPPRVSF